MSELPYPGSFDGSKALVDMYSVEKEELKLLRQILEEMRVQTRLLDELVAQGRKS